MTTYISLASSATMLPVLELGQLGKLRFSTLTPELVKARLAYSELIVSALNNDHEATINAIWRRYGLALPKSVPGPDGRAPKVTLKPGDELFVVQALPPRPPSDEVHSEATVQSAPISFLRWRLPVDVASGNVSDVPQSVFAEVIDHAHSIALWRRGDTRLQTAKILQGKFDAELAELKEAAKTRQDYAYLDESREALESFLDIYLKCADTLYYALQHWHVSALQGEESDLIWAAKAALRRDAVVSFDSVIDIMLAKYARRAAGQPKDIEVERRLAAPLIPRTAQLYA